jgi:hypothetical protein
MGHLTSGDVKEAWRTLRVWYRQAEDKASKPCYSTLEAQTVERKTLYDYAPSPGEPIPSNVDRPPMEDTHPADGELRLVVKKSRNGRLGGASKMRAEDLKKWLKGAGNEEQALATGEDSFEGTGDT